MLLNTISVSEILSSMSEIYSVSEKSIQEYIEEKGREIYNYKFDEYSISKFPLKDFERYIESNKRKILDEVIVNHITPRNSITSLLNEDILTLPKVLVEKTELSQYLNNIGIYFRIENNCIVMSKNGNDIDLSKLEQGNNLLMRFGGKNSSFDFNINGYMFTNYIPFERCRGWLGSPEILKSISNTFHDKSIANEYADNSKNFMISFKVPLQKIDIDCIKNNLSVYEKRELLLKYALNTLICKNYSVQYHNPIILLERSYVVPNDKIIQITKVILNKSESFIYSDEKVISKFVGKHPY